MIDTVVLAICHSTFSVVPNRYKTDLAYDIGFMLTTLSSGGVSGFLIGYAVKKGIKIIIGIAGLLLGGLAYLNYKGLVSVDWEKIASDVKPGYFRIFFRQRELCVFRSG